jgi:S-formylglutathione hydrolase FrmB
MRRCLVAGVVLVLCALPACAAGPLNFQLTFDPKAHPGPFTGRVYVMLLAGNSTSLASGPNWFRPEPFFARDVKNWKSGEVLVIDQTCQGHPLTLDRITKGTWTVQAVMDVAPGRHRFTQVHGNVYTIRRLALDPATTGPVKLNLDQVWKDPPFKETGRIKLIEIDSKLLTAFHKRPTRLRAAVLLPASHATSPARKYPVVYEIPGFSGDHRLITWASGRNASNVAGIDMIHVMLDPDCHHGHHVFADSANNGPCGKALIEELIPAIEKRFRGIGKPAARFVTGHSSGGWSSLWLQVAYPDFFGGCWSTSPDPVDFRDFQRINIYRPGENMFTDTEGNRRPIARQGGKAVLWYRDFSDMEEVMGHGGQLASFEAVFGERGADGKPRRLWDRKTGAIDPAVAKSWEKYDIRLVLEHNWKTLAPKLKGKLHVYMGDQDNFYLEGATRRLKETLEQLKSDAKVEIIPGYDHSTLLFSQKLGIHKRIASEMAARFKSAALNDQ